jgi:hypothetical protein
LSYNELKNSSIEVLDINGTVVYEKNISNFDNNSSIKVDLGHMLTGVYLLKIITSEKVYKRKLVLNK